MDGSRGSTRGRRSAGVRDRLVVAQIAIALVLTIGAGLLLRSLDRLLDNELGFDPRDRLAVQVWAYDDDHRNKLDFFDRGLEQIAAVPGVEAVGLTSDLPLANDQSILARTNTVRFTIDDRTPSEGAEPVAPLLVIDHGYTEAMGIALNNGRNFSTHDHSQSRPVAMINERFVRQHFGDQDPIGRHVTPEWRTGTSREIVGVLSNVRPQGFASEPRSEIYVPLAQEPANGLTFVVKTATDPASMVVAVQEALWTADPSQATWATRRMIDLLWDWSRQRRFNTALLVSFAGLALALAGVGVYALMSFSIAQRVNELGIRRALGGSTRDILGSVMRHGLTLALVGVGFGLIGSIALTHLLQGMLFDVSRFDLLTFASLSVFVIIVTMAAALLPTRRAILIDPMIALRKE